jgi:hypothetical protein
MLRLDCNRTLFQLKLYQSLLKKAASMFIGAFKDFLHWCFVGSEAINCRLAPNCPGMRRNKYLCP